MFVLDKSSQPSLTVWAWQGAYPRVDLSGAPLYGVLLALPMCIRLHRKRLASDKQSSFLQTLVNYGHKFYNIGHNVIKLFLAIIY